MYVCTLSAKLLLWVSTNTLLGPFVKRTLEKFVKRFGNRIVLTGLGWKLVFISNYLTMFLQARYIFRYPPKAALPRTRSDGCEGQPVGHLC